MAIFLYTNVYISKYSHIANFDENGQLYNAHSAIIYKTYPLGSYCIRILIYSASNLGWGLRA